MVETKQEIRKRILSGRDQIPVEDRKRLSEKIKEQMLLCPAYCEAEVILAYVSYRSEVDTIGLIEQAFADGKQLM